MDWSDPNTFVNRQIVGGRVKEIVDGMDFPDNYFDAVAKMLNEVLEHVEDLDQVIRDVSGTRTPAG